MKLKHVEKVASQRLIESMPFPNFEEDSNHLTLLLATVQENDDFEYDDETDKVEPRTTSEFLKRIEDDISDNPDNAAKMGLIRNKVLEKMKRTLRRERSPSISGSVCSRTSSKTRPRSEGEDADSQAAPKSKKCSTSKPSQLQSRLPAPIN